MFHHFHPQSVFNLILIIIILSIFLSLHNSYPHHHLYPYDIFIIIIFIFTIFSTSSLSFFQYYLVFSFSFSSKSSSILLYYHNLIITQPSVPEVGVSCYCQCDHAPCQLSRCPTCYTFSSINPGCHASRHTPSSTCCTLRWLN